MRPAHPPMDAVAAGAENPNAGRTPGIPPGTTATPDHGPTSRLNQKPFYITTAIDYANGLPHIGHALEKIGADTIVRYRRQRGDTVHFLMSMDEHRQMYADRAAAAGVSTREWTGRIEQGWQAAWRLLGIGYDDFIRTTEPRHGASVHEIIRRMEAGGELYKATYAG